MKRLSSNSEGLVDGSVLKWLSHKNEDLGLNFQYLLAESGEVVHACNPRPSRGRKIVMNLRQPNLNGAYQAS